MNIEDLRKQTESARTSKEAVEDVEFNESPLREYIDGLITQASKRGESKISPNFYYTKEEFIDLVWDLHDNFLESLDKGMIWFDTSFEDLGINWKG